MASKHSSASLSSKITRSVSKTGEKRALELLQDDAENCNSGILLNAIDVTPLQYDSGSAHRTRKKLKRICDDSFVRGLCEDSPRDSDNISVPSGPSSSQMNYGSHARAMVAFGNDSEQSRKSQCLIQPIKKERNHENFDGASDNPGHLKEITQFVEPPAENKVSTAMERALEIQANLSAAGPSFVKMMIFSNVSGSFWMHPPKKFAVNLPKEDCTIVLLDEDGKECNTKYLVHKNGLSAGWRGFSTRHALAKGDVLVFHLIHPTTFKVYIVREDRQNEVDGAVGHVGLDSGAGQIISVGDSTQKILHTEDITAMDSSPTNSDIDSPPEVLDGIRFSDSDIKFEAVSDFNNFNIIVDGLVIDSKFSQSNRHKYYDLCLSQHSFLHQNLLKGLNCNLAIGIILETINIADALKASDSSSSSSCTTSVDDLKTWKTTLDGFKLLGMNVTFLSEKLNQLLHAAAAASGNASSNRSEIASAGGSGNARMKDLDDKLSELKGVMERIDSEIEAEITASVQKFKAKVEQIDSFPW